MDNIEYKIYQDVDGCLADFDLHYKNLTGYLPKEYETKFGRTEFWKPISEAGETFWFEIPKMEDMDILWNYVSKYNLSLLTAPSREDSSRIGKIKWVSKYIPGTEIIFSPAREKKKYANKNAILIDDNENNIEDWKNAGGIGILHKSAINTISELKIIGL